VVTDVAPARTVLSFLHRDQPFDADAIATSATTSISSPTTPAAKEWTNQHDGTFAITLADRAEIARLANAARFPTT
jgi:hypothetical protein